MSPLKLKPKAFLSLAAIGIFSSLFSSQTVMAQRPQSSDSNRLLLSRNCDSQYVEIYEQVPVVSIGRETFNPAFYISSYSSIESGYLTCSLASANSGATPPTHLRLQFGLLDGAESDTRASVTAYVDGQEWGSIMLEPRQQAQVWLIEVKDASSISLEVGCIDNCAGTWSSSSAAQRVHFARAEFDFVGSSSSAPSQSARTSLPSNPPSASEGRSSGAREVSQTSRPSQSSSTSTGTLEDSIRGLENDIQEFLDIFN